MDVAVGIGTPGDQPALTIYPNPAHGRVLLKTAGRSAEISIFDQTGSKMPLAVKALQSGLFTIHISGLSAGFYLVSVRTAEGISKAKLVIY